MRIPDSTYLAVLGILIDVSAAKASPDSISDAAIVRNDAYSEKYCPDLAKGEICLMTQREAQAYCKERGGRLASTRDFARYMNLDAILEVDQLVGGEVPPGYYEVACVDESGQLDVFYFNNEQGRTGQKPRVLTGDLARGSFWTSSLVKGKPEYAHVFYGPLGGGGGEPADHHRERRHAVIFLRD